MSVKSSSALAPVVWGGSSSILNVTLIKGAVLDEFVVESFNNSMLVIRNLTSGKDIMSINSVVPGSFDVNPTRNQFAVSFQNGTIAIFAQNSSFFNDNLFHPIKVNNTGYSDSSIVWCQLSASNSNLMFFLRYYDVNSTFYLERYDFRDAANNHVFPFDASISIDIHATIKLVGDRYLFALSLDGSIYRWDLESWDPSNIHSSAPTDVFTSGFNNYLITPSSRYLIASTKGLILGWELS